MARSRLRRVSGARKALLRSLVTALFQYGRITTTESKAKELRHVADKMISLAKRGDLHARRQAEAFIMDKAVTKKLFDETAKKYTERNGGYTRVLKLEARLGDNAPKGIDMKRSNNTLFKDIRSHEVKARERILAAARGTYTVMDIETTGMYSDITEIAALRVVSGEIRDTFHTLVKAKGPIEKRVERLTGITSDMLEGQPPIGDVLPIFMTFIEGFPLVGHGLDSDLVVIDRNLKAVGKPLVTNDYIDTHSLAKLLLPEREGEHRKYSVKALVEYYELPCSTFHRAMDDCMAEKMLFERLLAEWK